VCVVGLLRAGHRRWRAGHVAGGIDDDADLTVGPVELPANDFLGQLLDDVGLLDVLVLDDGGLLDDSRPRPRRRGHTGGMVNDWPDWYLRAALRGVRDVRRLDGGTLDDGVLRRYWRALDAGAPESSHPGEEESEEVHGSILSAT
jgi:hypothetical protein